MNALLEKSDSEVMERVIIAGDLSKVSPQDRTKYYMVVCKSVGLNPYTNPFNLITLNGKMVLYASRTATDQLRQIHKVSIRVTGRHKEGDVYTVIATATTPDGRTDESTGVVTLTGLRGDALANTYMKAETKAKRRVTLSIVGLGWLDESESDSIPGAKKHTMDIETGEVKETKEAKEVVNEVVSLPWKFTWDRINEVSKQKNMTKDQLDTFIKGFKQPKSEEEYIKLLRKMNEWKVPDEKKMPILHGANQKRA
jgi:hypothetical protein